MLLLTIGNIVGYKTYHCCLLTALWFSIWHVTREYINEMKLRIDICLSVAQTHTQTTCCGILQCRKHALATPKSPRNDSQVFSMTLSAPPPKVQKISRSNIIGTRNDSLPGSCRSQLLAAKAPENLYHVCSQTCSRLKEGGSQYYPCDPHRL